MDCMITRFVVSNYILPISACWLSNLVYSIIVSCIYLSSSCHRSVYLPPTPATHSLSLFLFAAAVVGCCCFSSCNHRIWIISTKTATTTKRAREREKKISINIPDATLNNREIWMGICYCYELWIVHVLRTNLVVFGFMIVSFSLFVLFQHFFLLFFVFMFELSLQLNTV